MSPLPDVHDGYIAPLLVAACSSSVTLKKAPYAGISVESRLGAIYVPSGLAGSVAAMVYVAHLGQTKSDAGTGYELSAITAVVLGGTSIFGGRGTILGTTLGLFGIVILQNGLRLSGQPAQLADILTGVLLVVTTLLDGLAERRIAPPRVPTVIEDNSEEDTAKHSQIAVLSGVILASTLIVVAGTALCHHRQGQSPHPRFFSGNSR